jgi:hypothetical protein
LTLWPEPDLGLALLDALPEGILDDPQLGNFLLDHGIGRVRLGAPPARLRILDVAELVPDQLPDVEPIVQDAGAPLGVAVDR